MRTRGQATGKFVTKDANAKKNKQPEVKEIARLNGRGGCQITGKLK